MSVEELAEAAGEIADRKKTLKRLTGATLGLMGFAGLFPGRAMAADNGCTLCNPPTYCGGDYACGWCWPGYCHYDNPPGGAPHWHYCCEYYRTGPNPCGGSCPATCSALVGTHWC